MLEQTFLAFWRKIWFRIRKIKNSDPKPAKTLGSTTPVTGKISIFLTIYSTESEMGNKHGRMFTLLLIV
jgi:hypothetical protein